MAVGTGVVWIAVTALCGVVCAVGAARAYATTGEPNWWALAVVAVACAGCLELGTTNGYLPRGALFGVTSLLASALAVVFGLAALRATTGTPRPATDDAR